MPRYKLILAYDGSDFSGWQKQEPLSPALETNEPRTEPTFTQRINADKVIGTVQREGEDRPRLQLRTVQHVVERAARMVVREPVILMGASRTDSGVHARGQVAAFTCSDGEPEVEKSVATADADHKAAGPVEQPGTRGQGWPISRGADRLLRVLNSRLPEDVVVVSVEPVGPTFDPIRDCTAKAYSYTINVERERSLWDRRTVLHLRHVLDIGPMREAAKRFVGEHDFNAFAAAGHGRTTTVRTVFSCAVNDESGPAGRRVRIDISGNGFLYNMVRIIGGTLVEVGRGRKAPEAVTAAIESRDRRNAGPTLPPQGLCLEWVRYGEGAASMLKNEIARDESVGDE